MLSETLKRLTELRGVIAFWVSSLVLAFVVGFNVKTTLQLPDLVAQNTAHTLALERILVIHMCEENARSGSDLQRCVDDLYLQIQRLKERS